MGGTCVWGCQQDSRPTSTRGDQHHHAHYYIVEFLFLGFSVGSLGFYTPQTECQYKSNFLFEVKFPFILVTWSFDLAERWIQ
jgi:hypothetical protein